MVSVILNWIYIMITAGITGAGVLYPFYKRGYSFRHADSFFFAGITTVTVYAQFFSLFGGVGLAANTVLFTACIALCVFCGRGMWAMVKESLPERMNVKAAAVLLLVLLVFAYGTSTGYMMYDSNLYHAQSIRWIEEFGVVRGLGNLQSRLAYNSASFCLSALYSMVFLTGQSLHTVAGLFALVTGLDALKFLRAFARKRLLLSDFARVGALYYITIIYKEMMSPASDYFTILLLFYIVIRWLDLLERKETDVTPYALICVCGVYAITLKISAGLILLLVLQPAVMLLRRKQWKKIALFLGLGILTAAPYFIRNIIISGWLVYPYTAIDLFDFSWKIPIFRARYDAQEIQVWGRGIYDVAAYHTPFIEWMPDWFGTQLSGMEKVIVLGAAASIPVLLVYAIVALARKKRGAYPFLLVQFTMLSCFLLWLFSAPMMRYGYCYPLLLPLLTFGAVFLPLQKRGGRVYLPLLLCLCAVSFYRVVRMGEDAARQLQSKGIALMQQDYDEYEAQACRLGNITVYLPVQGDQIGYSHFPSTQDVTDVLPGGDSLEDGFLYYYR